MRLSIVRGFARHWSATDPSTEVPPLGLLPYRPKRAQPYFYSDHEIRTLLNAAKSRPSIDPLRPWTYHCLFGLLAVTGLRLGEALSLRPGDMDWSEGILTIRGAKFGKSRLVPLHTSTCKVLADYAKRRDERFGVRAEGYFLVNLNGNRLDKGEVHRAFYILSRQIGLRAVDASRGPRLHDFRHRADSPVMPTCLRLVPYSPLFYAELRASWLVEVGIIRVVFSELALKPIKEKTNVGRVFGAVRRRQTTAKQSAGSAPLAVCSIPGGGRLCRCDDQGKTVVT
jgi:integrase